MRHALRSYRNNATLIAAIDTQFRPRAAVRELREPFCVPTTVLLVEDDTHNLQALTIYLKLRGVQVEQAHDGFEALQKLDHNTFHVVVSDLRMPGLSGLDLAKHIHEKLDGVPVVLMTGDPTAPALSDLNESDVFDLLVKPFMPDELVKTIRRALGDREL